MAALMAPSAVVTGAFEYLPPADSANTAIKVISTMPNSTNANNSAILSEPSRTGVAAAPRLPAGACPLSARLSLSSRGLSVMYTR